MSSGLDLNDVFADLQSGDPELMRGANAILTAIFEGDDADLKLEVGKIYDEGMIVKSDKSEAMRWWGRAATDGNRDAVLYMHSLIEECEELASMVFEGRPANGTDGIDVLGIMAQKERTQQLAVILGVELPNADAETDTSDPALHEEDDDPYGLFPSWEAG